MTRHFAVILALVLVAGITLSPGCLYLTCDTFYPVNLEWHQPGAFHEMPSEGEYAGFQVWWRTHEDGFKHESKLADRNIPLPEMWLNVHENDNISLLAKYDRQVSNQEFYNDLRSAFADLGLSSPIAADEQHEPMWGPGLCD